MEPTYAIWRGDDCIAIGTVSELAETLGVRPETVKWYATPTAHMKAEECKDPRGRLVAIRI
jgi:hypothetical protein